MKQSFECLILLLKGIGILRDIWDQTYVTVKASDSHFTRNSLSDRDPQLTIPIAQAWELRVL